MIKKRHVLIATPIKNGASSDYMQGLMSIMLNPHPKYLFTQCVIQGPSVNFARNECVEYGYEKPVDELLFIDDDMMFNMSFAERVLSHDVDIVGGIYCKRQPGPPKWLLNPKAGAKVQPDGLIEVDDIATGFMRIKMSVFRKLYEKMPERHFLVTTSGRDEVRCEYFPMGVVGPRTADARLERITEILDRRRESDTHMPDNEYLSEIANAVHDSQPPGILRGEDYYFTHLARKHGFRVYADTHLVVRHLGAYPYPEERFMSEQTEQ